MTPRAPRTIPSRRRTVRRGEGPSRITSVIGVPIPVILIALLVSGLLGLQLAFALEQSTASRARTAASAVDSASGAGKNSSGLPVVTETTLGTEVQRLVDSGMIQPPTSFDATSCLREQGISESILIMEEVAWSADESPSWLLVHGPMDSETLRANGGTVSATVVQPGCGTTGSGGEAQDTTPLWSGHVMIGSL
jgi:hypothetical protein